MLYTAILSLQLASILVSAIPAKLPPVVYLQADNGRYLSRFDSAIAGPATNIIKAEKRIRDPTTRFRVIRIDPISSTYAFKADNGKFLCWVKRPLRTTIEANKNRPDIPCQFEVDQVRPGIITIKAKTGNAYLYWSRITRGRIYHPIEMTVSEPDHCSSNRSSWFRVITPGMAG